MLVGDETQAVVKLMLLMRINSKSRSSDAGSTWRTIHERNRQRRLDTPYNRTRIRQGAGDAGGIKYTGMKLSRESRNNTQTQ